MKANVWALVRVAKISQITAEFHNCPFENSNAVGTTNNIKLLAIDSHLSYAVMDAHDRYT